MRWAVVTIVIVAALAWLSVTMPLSNVLPGGRSTGENLKHLDSVLVPDPDWDATEQLVEHTEKSWQRLEPWLEFLHEKGTVGEFRSALARLTGAVEIRDLGLARQELQELRVLWDDLNRL